MRIDKKVIGWVSTNVYIVINEETKDAFVIDPAADEPKLTNYFEENNYNLKGILLTHGHFDHLCGVEALVNKYGCPVYATEGERALLASAEMNHSCTIRKNITVTDYIVVNDGEELELAGIKMKVITTPGHTAGGVCYYVEQNGVLFSGDTLFHETIGRTDLPTGSYDELVRSVKEKLMVLPEDTIVYPGHMSETTIEHERTHNPYTR